MPRDHGLTLVELVVALAVAAVLVTFALPGLAGLLAEQRVITTTNRFVAALNLARAEAVRRGTRVTLCASADGLGCGSANGYGDGWILIEGPAPGAVLTDPAPVLRVFAPAGGVLVEGNGEMGAYVSYVATGETRRLGGGLGMGSVTICDGNRARRVVINRTGRARVEPSVC